MEPELAQWLVSPAAADALLAAEAEADPGSLGAAQRMRKQWAPDQAAAALTQVSLRRRAVTKFGAQSAALFFTPAGLEQATRAEVAQWRAQMFAEAGVHEVVDLGCGLGADALAFRHAGLAVRAVDADPVTAIFAEANLGSAVTCADATVVAEELLAGGAAVFLDPARRTGAGRTWRVADFSPPWEWAVELLAARFGCIKAAPGLPLNLIPAGFGASWVSHRGDLVEVALWPSGVRQALLLPSGDRLEVGGTAPVGELGAYMYEPDPAVIRSGAIGALAEELGARRPADGIGYLFADQAVSTPFATVFTVHEELDFDQRTLRAWVRDHGIGTLEIKCRGIDVDPAALRRQLKPRGSGAATLVLTPTNRGARALIVSRK